MLRYFPLLLLCACTAPSPQAGVPQAPEPQPIWGHRFVLRGDFDGDGHEETLTERYCSHCTGQEVPKYFTDVEYGELVGLAVSQQPYCYMASNNLAISSLPIADDLQLFGLAFAKNEGDLNADGTDEVSYVVDWADESSLNSWHIVTWRSGKWQRLYRFPMRDFDLPPQAPDSLGDFEGLIRKVGKKTIQVYTTDYERDTVTVRFR